MKKGLTILLIVLTIISLTGCGTSELDNKDNNSGNNISEPSTNDDKPETSEDKPSGSNQTLICIGEDEDEDKTQISKYTLIYDKEGKKLETLIDDDTLKFKETRLSEYNVEQYKNECKELNTNYKGLSCEYNIKDDKKTSEIILKVDYANLDTITRKYFSDEGKVRYLAVEKDTLEETKEFMEEIKYTCSVE